MKNVYGDVSMNDPLKIVVSNINHEKLKYIAEKKKKRNKKNRCLLAIHWISLTGPLLKIFSILGY